MLNYIHSRMFSFELESLLVTFLAYLDSSALSRSWPVAKTWLHPVSPELHAELLKQGVFFSQQQDYWAPLGNRENVNPVQNKTKPQPRHQQTFLPKRKPTNLHKHSAQSTFCPCTGWSSGRVCLGKSQESCQVNQLMCSWGGAFCVWKLYFCN